MPQVAAGLLVYRRHPEGLQVLLVHPGGPFWAKKDAGAWMIPKGEVDPDEDLLVCAKREFKEETGQEPPAGTYRALQPIKQKAGKIVHAWAVEGDIDTSNIVSNTFPLEWPPRSGKRIEVPEIDKAEYFDLETAKQKINAAQVALLDELAAILTAE